jgi:hypothetical protein
MLHIGPKAMLCLFYGSTPITKSPDKILPYSPVNIVGRIIAKDDNLDEFKDHSTVAIKLE